MSVIESLAELDYFLNFPHTISYLKFNVDLFRYVFTCYVYRVPIKNRN
jgi:hypothetical protein